MPEVVGWLLVMCGLASIGSGKRSPPNRIMNIVMGVLFLVLLPWLGLWVWDWFNRGYVFY